MAVASPPHLVNALPGPEVRQRNPDLHQRQTIWQLPLPDLQRDAAGTNAGTDAGNGRYARCLRPAHRLVGPSPSRTGLPNVTLPSCPAIIAIHIMECSMKEGVPTKHRCMSLLLSVIQPVRSPITIGCIAFLAMQLIWASPVSPADYCTSLNGSNWRR